jgi:hypothetical protein
MRCWLYSVSIATRRWALTEAAFEPPGHPGRSRVGFAGFARIRGDTAELWVVFPQGFFKGCGCLPRVGLWRWLPVT